MLTAYYDLSKNPPTYDFVTFLLWAECMRLDRKEDSLEIAILPGPNHGFRQDGLWPQDIQVRRDLLNKIALPMATLLPSCKGITSWSTRPQQKQGSVGYGVYTVHFARFFIEAMTRGVRPLRFPGPVQHNPSLITITLRESEHWPFRNSNQIEWMKAAYTLALDYGVVFVRDTLHADEPLADYNTDPKSSRDMIARARLYASAALNLFVSNGPAWLALAMDAPTIIFKPTSNQGPGFFRSIGIPHGEQMPKSPPYQQLVWAEDTCDNIVRQVQMFLGQQQRVVA